MNAVCYLYFLEEVESGNIKQMFCIFNVTYIHVQTDRSTRVHRRTDRCSYTQTDAHTHRQTDVHRWTDRHRQTHTHTHRHTDGRTDARRPHRHMYTETDRHRWTDGWTKFNTETDGQTDAHTNTCSQLQNGSPRLFSYIWMKIL